MTRESLPAELRAAVWNKTDPPGRCWYCGRPLSTESGWPSSFVVEHGDPRCRNGTNDLENLRPSCSECNLKKGTYRTYEVFREDTRAALKAAAELLLRYAGIKVAFDAKKWNFWGDRK